MIDPIQAQKWRGKVNLERHKQDVKWGEQNHTPSRWHLILAEEVGELAKAILEDHMGEVEKELIQAAAVCQAMWEAGKRNGWL